MNAATEPTESKPEAPSALAQIRRFFAHPSRQRTLAIGIRWRKWLPWIPFPIRLPFGGWWLARNDYSGRVISQGQFECPEFAFVTRFLRPGMTVLDAGAHHGFYTLLLSKCVGPNGRVFAFEPSPRERKVLRRHVLLNRCKNVSIQELALGCEESNATLFVVQGEQTGCNSLRTPAWDVPGEFSPTTVRVVPLDDWLENQKIKRVDFIKLDIEGGELDALKGAARLLACPPRPVVLAELQDIRTAPWGYKADDVAVFVESFGFKWFMPLDSGLLAAFRNDSKCYEHNLIAIPEERVEELSAIIKSGGAS